MNICLYDKDSVDPSVIPVLRMANYECIPLTSNPSVFWGAIELLEEKDSLILISHGDKDGPLMVKGTSGKDMTVHEQLCLAQRLFNLKVKFFCFSCHTAYSPLCNVLNTYGVVFVAPQGFASMKASQAGLYVHSMEGDKFTGWVGSPSLIPRRNSTGITIYGR